ncbi:MAG TPA: periplasmic heavy metal sensor [Candidatus Acidoferrum sp.]|nr:periplasmic heavy metal sensor [Candidatus Acidoferrum sp.]
MKRSWLILLGGLAAAAVGYACIYLPAIADHQTLEQGPHPELAWLKKEYHLSDSQFARVVELHDAYWPKCAELCKRIDKQNAKVQQLLAATNTVTPEIKQALAEAAQLRVECQSAMMEHFYEVSRAMPPTQGKRYLAWVQQETLLPGQMLPTGPASGAEHR